VVQVLSIKRDFHIGRLLNWCSFGRSRHARRPSSSMLDGRNHPSALKPKRRRCMCVHSVRDEVEAISMVGWWRVGLTITLTEAVRGRESARAKVNPHGHCMFNLDDKVGQRASAALPQYSGAGDVQDSSCSLYGCLSVMLFALSHKGRRVRLAAIWIPTVVVIGAALLLFLRLICVPILVYFRPGLDVFIYDLAVYGVYPQRHYRSFHLASPSPRTLVWKAGVCQQESSDGGLVIMDLHGAGVSDSGPAVLDLKGNLVWTNDTFGGHAMNVKVQTYEGQEHLTFWAGDDEDHGNCYMLDSGFNLAYTISAVGDNLWDDPHQCKITEDGTALIIAFNFTEADLSSTHVAHLGSFIVDAVIQEIDIESGELVFEWRASDHVADNNEYLKSTFDAPFVRHSKKYHDYFHMNSVDKDSNGNLLVSIRHTHSIINIDTKTGQILWGFGGTSRDFEDLSGGLASNFHGQHDARWVDEGKGLLSEQSDLFYGACVCLEANADLCAHDIRLVRQRNSRTPLARRAP